MFFQDEPIFVGSKFYTLQYDRERISAAILENVASVTEAKIIFEEAKKIMPPKYQFLEMTVGTHPIVLPRFIEEKDAEIFFGALV